MKKIIYKIYFHSFEVCTYFYDFVDTEQERESIALFYFPKKG